MLVMKWVDGGTLHEVHRFKNDFGALLTRISGTLDRWELSVIEFEPGNERFFFVTHLPGIDTDRIYHRPAVNEVLKRIESYKRES